MSLGNIVTTRSHYLAPYFSRNLGRLEGSEPSGQDPAQSGWELSAQAGLTLVEVGELPSAHLHLDSGEQLEKINLEQFFKC